MKSPITKLRTAFLAVLFSLSLTFTSNAVAEDTASFAEQIALAVVAGIKESGLQGDALVNAIAQTAAAAALTNPDAAAAIAAAVAAASPEASAAIAAAVAAAVPAKAGAIAAAVANINPAAAAAINEAVEAAKSSESVVNNTDMKANVIIDDLQRKLKNCTDDQCRADAAKEAARLAGSSPDIAALLSTITALTSVSPN